MPAKKASSSAATKKPAAPQQPAAPKKEAPKPVKLTEPEKDRYVMLRGGACQGASGQWYKFKKGDVLETEPGELDHLGERISKKK